ncbi:MAG: hypothetical protein AAF604_23525 [Acidobacteriota bacterium]
MSVRAGSSLFAGLFAVMFGMVAEAQNLENEDGVAVYRDPSFEGIAEIFDRDVPDMRRTRVGDDRVTSVAVSRNCVARLYQHPNYGGRFTEVRDAIADLRGSEVGDDSVSSLQVRCQGTAIGGPHGVVTVYRDLSFRGVSESFDHDMPDLRRSRVGDDTITSVSVSRDCVARLYQHPNFGGRYTEVRDAIADLRGSEVGDDGASSLQVRCDLHGGSHVGVTLYRDLSFRGVAESFDHDMSDLRRSRVGDDTATSVEVSRGCEARLYQHPNFGGRSTEVRDAIADLRGSEVGDDGASSVRVRCDDPWNDDSWHGDFWSDDWDSEGPANEVTPRGASLYSGAGFRGMRTSFDDEVRDLDRHLMNGFRSLRLSAKCGVRLYREVDFSGPYVELWNDEADLGSRRYRSLRLWCD